MMEHYEIDGLVEYGSKDLPGTAEVVNPAWRTLDKSIRSNRQSIQKLYAELGKESLKDDDTSMQKQAELHQDEQNNCLYIRIHRMACPAHDKAIGALLKDISRPTFVILKRA